MDAEEAGAGELGVEGAPEIDAASLPTPLAVLVARAPGSPTAPETTFYVLGAWGGAEADWGLGLAIFGMNHALRAPLLFMVGRGGLLLREPA